jgi:uncharacterized glyoxalase superfamily protein PhnB
VTAYLFVENPQELTDLLKKAFFAEEINRSINPTNNDIANCLLQIADSCFITSQAREQFLKMRTALYLFVDNVDEMHKRALENGAKSEFGPEN